eukprot:g1779.t1
MPQPSTMASFDLLASLKDRLSQKKLERFSIEEMIRSLEAQVHSALRRAPRRPRESLAELQTNIEKLEWERSTSSNSLQAEKQLLRRIKDLEQRKRAHAEVDQFDLMVRELREQIDRARAKLPMMHTAIKELQDALRKFEVSRKIFATTGEKVQPSELTEVSVSIPPAELPTLRGRNGENVERLEKQYHVVLDIDARNFVVNVVGSQIGVNAALFEIEAIASAIAISVPVTPNDVRVLLLQKASHLRNIENDFSVRCNLNRGAKAELIIRGLEEQCNLAKKRVEEISKGCCRIPLEQQRFVYAIIGRNGTTVNELQREHLVDIQLLSVNANGKNQADGKFKLCEIRGPEAQVAKAEVEVRKIIAANTVSVETVSIEASRIPAVVGKGGFTIRKMEQSTGCRVQVDRRLSKPDEGPVVKLTGTPSQLADGREAVKMAIEKWEKENTLISVTPIQLQALFGRNDQLKMVQKKLGDNVKFEVKWRENLVRLQGDENALVEARKVIQQILDVVRTETIKVHPDVLGTVIGKKGSQVTSMQKESGATIQVDKDKEEVQIIGTEETVAKALELVRTVLRENTIVEVPVLRVMVGEIVGKGGSEAKKFQTEYSVKLNVERNDESDGKRRNKSSTRKNIVGEGHVTIMLRGEASKVAEAAKALEEKVILWKKEHAVMHVFPSACGLLIGKGGATIKKVRAETECAVECDLSSGQILLRGKEECIKKAITAVTEIVGEHQVRSETSISLKMDVPKDNLSAVIGKGGNQIKKFEAQYSVSIDVKREKGITLYGEPEAVKQCEAGIIAYLERTIRVNHEIKVPRKKMEHVFGKTLNGLRQLRMTTGARIDAEIESLEATVPGTRKQKQGKNYIVKINGTKAGAALAVAAVNAAKLGKMSISVKLADTEHLDMLAGSAYPNLLKVQKDTECVITLDEKSNSVIIVGAVAKVQEAKTQMQNLLSFFFRDNYFRLSSPNSFFGTLFANKAEKLRQLEEGAGNCSIDIDREGLSILLRGSADAVRKVRSDFEALLKEHAKENAELRIPHDELIPTIIGQKGSTIKELREKSGANFDIDRDNMTITVRGKKEQVEEGKRLIEEIFVKFENRRFELKINPDFAPTLIGKGGATIRTLQNDTGCRINVDSNLGVVVVRASDEEKLPAARELIEAMISEYEERRHREIMESTREEEENRKRQQEERERIRAERELQKANENENRNMQKDEYPGGWDEATRDSPPLSVQNAFDAIPLGATRQSKSSRRRQRQQKAAQLNSDSTALSLLMGMSIGDETNQNNDNAAAEDRNGGGYNGWDNLNQSLPETENNEQSQFQSQSQPSAMSLLGMNAPPGFGLNGTTPAKATTSTDTYYRSATGGYRVRL